MKRQNGFESFLSGCGKETQEWSPLRAWSAKSALQALTFVFLRSELFVRARGAPLEASDDQMKLASQLAWTAGITATGFCSKPPGGLP